MEPQIQTIRLSRLWIDSRYQQRPNERQVQRIAEQFDTRLAAPLIVSRRRRRWFSLWQRYVLVDGVHRSAAMKRNGIKVALCAVYPPLDEARTFAQLNAVRRR